MFVEEAVADQLVEQLADKARAIRLGHGLDPSTDMGPLISARHRDRVLSFVDGAKAEGARVVTGGGTATVDHFEGGFFVAPTVIAGVRNSMQVAQEEISAPSFRSSPGTTPTSSSCSPTTSLTGWRPASGPGTRRRPCAWPNAWMWAPCG